MLRAWCLTVAGFVLFAGSAFADAEADLGKNAALKYWQAFAQLPKLSDAESDKLNRECLTMPLDAHARELAKQSAYALDMLHYGAAIARCNWGVDHEPGIATRLPQAQASRALTALAVLRARLRFEEGQAAGALDDLVDSLTLARHVSVGGVSIMVLVGYSIEKRTSDALATALPKLHTEELRKLQARLKALPASGSPAQALPLEDKSFEISVIRPVKETKDKESLLSLLSQLFVTEGKNGDAREHARTFLEACGGTADGVIEKAAALKGSYQRLAPAMSQPIEECLKAWEHEAASQANNPVFKEFSSSLPIMRWRQLQAEVRRALLQAAVAVQLGGRDALQGVPDPIAGGTFEYVPFEGGFELRSKLAPGEQFRSKFKLSDSSGSLSLTVGVRKK